MIRNNIPSASTFPIGRDRIESRVNELGREILRDAIADQGVEPSIQVTILSILYGAARFTTDLERALRLPNGKHPHNLVVLPQVVHASLYPTERANDAPKLTFFPGIEAAVAGRHVLITDDIIDSGKTLSAVYNAVRKMNPSSLRTAVLLDKPSRRLRENAMVPTYVGFQIPNVWAVGYGMDYGGLYRHLPHIVTLDYARRHFR